MSFAETEIDAEPACLQLLLVDHVGLDHAQIVPFLHSHDIRFALRCVDSERQFKEALAAPVDLVLSEISLPQFSAARVLSLLREHDSDIPVILLTDAGNEHLAADLLRQGAVDYVFKDRPGRLQQSVKLAVERARLLRRLNQKNLTMARLSRQLVKAQEAERSHLARELHDELGQRITALNMRLYQLHPGPGNALLPVWQEAQRAVGELVTQARNLSSVLRPPELDYVGLQGAISHLLEQRYSGTWREQVFEYVGLRPRLPPLLEITCYRLVQESLTNIARHARARSVVIEMVGNGGSEVEIIVRDDGVGFDIALWEQNIALRPSGGVIGMRERARLLGGTLSIDSRPGHGTRVTAILPMNEGDTP